MRSPIMLKTCSTLNRNYRRALGLLLAGLMLLAPISATPYGVREPEATPKRLTDGQFTCGYDPRGADEQLYNHKLHYNHRLHSRGRRSGDRISLQSSEPKVEDRGEVAHIEDDGSIVMSPNNFDLKKRGLLFAPDGDGYRVTRGRPQYETEIGYKLGYYFGPGGALGDANNGYRDIDLGGVFPFFGVEYDTIFIGTNGYITFTGGDTTARPSASALASEMPRIAPLWSDLNANESGGIYYNKLPDRHVITWKEVPQDKYKGSNTFQVILYQDGHMAFVYKKINARSSLIGISPGNSDSEAEAIDLSKAAGDIVGGAFYETFSVQKRLDLPALTRAFYSAHGDRFDSVCIWTDFEFDNGIGYATSFNVRNDITGIGLRLFDRGSQYGSASRLSTVVIMGNVVEDWPPDPDSHVVGLFTGVGILCHELGHRWLAYIRFDAEHDIKDDLLGREASHWSFLADTRTDEEGRFSSVMEGNVWRDNGSNVFTSMQSSANYFSELDQYLMGLRAVDEVGKIPYLVITDTTRAYIRSNSPAANFTIGATRKQATVSQIIEREGPRIPDAADSPKQFRTAFILLTEQGARPSDATVETVDRYRRSITRYFSVATDRRGSLESSLAGE